MDVIEDNGNVPLNEYELRRLARKRVGFKTNLVSYIIINMFLSGIWFFTTPGAYFWPMWPIMGWGIGLVFNYIDAYMHDAIFSVEKEYQKLKETRKQ
jgi:hypothetical protein